MLFYNNAIPRSLSLASFLLILVLGTVDRTVEENKTKKGPANRSTRSTLSLQMKEMDSISDPVEHCSVVESNVVEVRFSV